MKLPRTTGEKVIRALVKAGFEAVGIRGNHHYLHHPQSSAIVTVLVHSGKTLRQRRSRQFFSRPGFRLNNSGLPCNRSCPARQEFLTLIFRYSLAHYRIVKFRATPRVEHRDAMVWWQPDGWHAHPRERTRGLHENYQVAWSTNTASSHTP